MKEELLQLVLDELYQRNLITMKNFSFAMEQSKEIIERVNNQNELDNQAL